jgi:hypothetical protein
MTGGSRKQPVNFRIVARLDRKCLGRKIFRESGHQHEAFSMSRLEGSRWRLRQMRAMGIEWAFAL